MAAVAKMVSYEMNANVCAHAIEVEAIDFVDSRKFTSLKMVVSKLKFVCEYKPLNSKFIAGDLSAFWQPI